MCDFLDTSALAPAADFVVTNPPFSLAVEFALRALEVAHRGVALLVRTNWLAGGERYRGLAPEGGSP